MRFIPHSLRRSSMNCAVFFATAVLPFRSRSTFLPARWFLGAGLSLFYPLLVARIRYRREKRVLGLARVQPRVLHDDGHVRLDQASVVRVRGDRLGVRKLVEAYV